MDTTRSSIDIARRISQTIGWLKEDYGVQVTPGTPLCFILELVQKEVSRSQSQDLLVSGQLPASHNRAIRGLELLCERLWRARDMTGIPAQFRNWIKQIGVGIPSMCSSYSDFPTDVRGGEKVRQASTDLFELVVGLSALEVGSNIRLESRGPQGKPDVRVDVDGQTWGFACRVSNSANPQQHFSILADAATKTVAQLDKGLADYAVIVLCVQNVFQRHKICYPDFLSAQTGLKHRMLEFIEDVKSRVSRERREAELLFRDARILPGALVYFEDVVEIGSFNEFAVPTQQGFINYVPLSYAQYVTFDSIGKELTDVPERLAIALTGPDTENIVPLLNVP